VDAEPAGGRAAPGRLLRSGAAIRRASADHGCQVASHAFVKLKPWPEQLLAVSRYQNW
jgi:hypothetical protein